MSTDERKIRLATWNIRGLADDYKKEELGNDFKKYNLDMIAIQETKISEKDEIT